MVDERRRFQRIPIDAPVSLQSMDGETYEGRVIDISAKGMKAKLATPNSLSGKVVFHVHLAEGEASFTIEGEAEIVRQTEDGHVGVFLLAIDVDSLTHLRRLIELNLGDAEVAKSEISHW